MQVFGFAKYRPMDLRLDTASVTATVGQQHDTTLDPPPPMGSIRELQPIVLVFPETEYQLSNLRAGVRGVAWSVSCHRLEVTKAQR